MDCSNFCDGARFINYCTLSRLQKCREVSAMHGLKPKPNGWNGRRFVKKAFSAKIIIWCLQTQAHQSETLTLTAMLSGVNWLINLNCRSYCYLDTPTNSTTQKCVFSFVSMSFHGLLIFHALTTTRHTISDAKGTTAQDSSTQGATTFP